MPIREKIEEFITRAVSTASYVAQPNADQHITQQMVAELKEEAEKLKEEMSRVLR